MFVKIGIGVLLGRYWVFFGLINRVFDLFGGGRVWENVESLSGGGDGP